uniref:Protein NUCLEAR FUSION DEFECTIVE 6, chloroplastic/mitochondrial-like n=1 Tax=Nelumbo nucifera TaxID=4432 RepID=A0A822YTV7_NELNU|nr:TPA_asm: hypothetical protein HUJ06_006183 [Nelumbo nucifera]
MSVPTILARLSTRSPSLVRKLYKNEISPAISSFKSSSQSQVSASAKRIYGTSRLPLELSSLVSMMPLHSAIASARLRSSLSIESQSWGLIPQACLLVVAVSPGRFYVRRECKIHVDDFTLFLL